MLQFFCLCRASLVFSVRFSVDGLDASGAFFGTGSGFISIFARSQRNTHTTPQVAFRFSKEAQIAIGHLERMGDAFEGNSLLF